MALNLASHFEQEVIVNIEENVDNDCCICYETIGKTNNCVTPCGHSFCFKCLMKCMSLNNTCPMCRTLLEDEKEIEEEEDDDEYDNEDEEDDDDNSVSEYLQKDTEGTAETISTRLSSLGYNMTDIIAIYIGRFDTVKNPRYNREFILKMEKDFDNTVKDADTEAENEVNERDMFMEEDTRRHSRPIRSVLDTVGEEEGYLQLIFA